MLKGPRTHKRRVELIKMRALDGLISLIEELSSSLVSYSRVFSLCDVGSPKKALPRRPEKRAPRNYIGELSTGDIYYLERCDIGSDMEFLGVRGWNLSRWLVPKNSPTPWWPKSAICWLFFRSQQIADFFSPAVLAILHTGYPLNRAGEAKLKRDWKRLKTVN